MAGRMQADGNPIAGYCLVVRQSLNRNIFPKSQSQDTYTILLTDIMPTAPAGMVAVAMGNHGCFHRHPRIDIDISLGTINSSFGKLEHEESLG